jgi:hypothetical protein
MSYYFSCPDQEKRRSVKNFECECLKVSAKYWQKFPRASERELDDINCSADFGGIDRQECIRPIQNCIGNV